MEYLENQLRDGKLEIINTSTLMRNYEVTFIVDPVLSGDEIKATAQKYVNQLQDNNCSIVHVDEMGLHQLAYQIKKRHSGYYYCVEFQSENGEIIAPLELTMSRDEHIMRFLSVSLDKYGIKYNSDKREGLIGKVKHQKKTEPVEIKKPKPVKKAVQQPDNLKRIEGIGPKIAEVLRAAGIDSFAKIAKMTADDIRDVLTEAGDRFSFQDPTTWSDQAKMAAAGQWDELKAWQEDLKGSKVEKTDSSEEE